MKVVIILLGVVSTCWAANSCDKSLGEFLNALKGEIDRNPKGIEEEFRDDYATLVGKCFSDSSSGNKCYLSSAELKGDPYGENGPMRGCTRCQNLVRGLRDKLLKSPAATRKCFRKKLAQAIREELEPCIQNKISNGYDFRVPEIPDLEENTFSNMDVVEAGVDYRIMARSRMDACKNVNPGKASNTEPCMKNEFPGIYPKHCQASKNAKAKVVSGGCSARFSEIKKAVVQCFDDKREDWHRKFDRIKAVVEETANGGSASVCAQKISDTLGSWLGKVESALSECMPDDKSKKNLHTLIELGCGQVANGGIGKDELTKGFRFIRLFLDALNDRLTVYTGVNCDF